MGPFNVENIQLFFPTRNNETNYYLIVTVDKISKRSQLFAGAFRAEGIHFHQGS
jgi:hypothetical protein